jgi:hypothetical protein
MSELPETGAITHRRKYQNNMPVSRAIAVAKSVELQSLQAELRSWRKVSRLHYPKVKPGTLCRIAKEPGWLPKDKKILAALGVLAERKHADEHTLFVRRKIRTMAKELQYEIDEATHQTLS